ncbi:MAG: penicillin-binding protein [Candidatus Saccharimonadales bacterium]
MPHKSLVLTPLRRIQIWYALLAFVCALFIVRLFYLQIIRHDYYQKTALQGQLKDYEIPAVRGVIAAHTGDQITPLVLNEKLFTLFADPKFIQDPHESSLKINAILGGNPHDYEVKMRLHSRYVILGKKLTSDQKKQIDSLNIKGVGTREASYRTYPNGTLASQLLGFVNDDSEGVYGIEQALNSKLKGKPGQLKAITDAQGVPLVGNKDNIDISPQQGRETVLTIDTGMQQQLEEILKQGLDNAHSPSGSALIIDPNSGAIKAMANYPTYDPGQYYKVVDPAVFNNSAVSSPLEVGSIMKTLTASAAIDQGVISKDTTFYDPGKYSIDGATVRDIEEDGGAGVRSVTDILTYSLNTGATWMLMQMGGGQINQKARDTWHDYMVNHFHLGSPVGIEQGYEASGYIPSPNTGYGINIAYANTAFGQAMTATPIQMAGAVSSVINGGTYYVPHLIEGYMDDSGNEVKNKPSIWKSNVVKPDVGEQLKTMMEAVVNRNYVTYKMTKPSPSYIIGGKTGTAQIANPSGGYFEDKFNGTFVGFVGGIKPQYLIVVRVNTPKINTYAGAGAAAPIFGKLTDMLINNFDITPKG